MSRLAAAFLLAVCALPAQSSPSDPGAFLFDLGIAIEPRTGKEEVNRLVKAPPDEVKFLANKETSGSLFMASTKEIQSTLQGLASQLAVLEATVLALESSVKQNLNGLQKQNDALHVMVSDMAAQVPVLPTQVLSTLSRVESSLARLGLESSPPAVASSIGQETPAPLSPIAQEMPSPPPVVTLPSETAAPPASMTEAALHAPFDQARYMQAVFAYEREDFEEALDGFGRLVLDRADETTGGNVIYWTADCQFHLGLYQQAIRTLAELHQRPKSDKVDDGLVLMGLAFKAIGEQAEARARFSEIVTLYPESDYYALAQLELRRSSQP